MRISVFGSSAFNVARTVKSMIKPVRQDCILKIRLVRNAAVIVRIKRFVSKEEMVDRIRAAVDAKTDPDFVIMARTDALAVEGLDAGDRACAGLC
ncbi:methylisocitrate lyase [Escherichia coli]|uniref:Methylisocitrate lyase n=1 Tax=Escherichia coli TaxID=562 RepID=A0A2X1N257_ECOLX|nr:methylisocitrate lyase [Escherichia coli]